jgi:hypothetical protein
VYLTACLTLLLQNYIPLYRLPLNTMSKSCCFYVSQSRIIHDATKRLWELNANLWQWTIDSWNSALPGLSGCNGSSLYWDPLFFPLWPCLQNRRGLDLFTAEKGRLCLFLGEDCCFFTNKSGIVSDGIKKKNLRDKAQQLTSSQPTNILSSLYPWLIPLWFLSSLFVWL